MPCSRRLAWNSSSLKALKIVGVELAVSQDQFDMRSILTFLLVASLALNVALFGTLWFQRDKTQISNTATDLVVMRTKGGLLEVSTVAAEERFDSTTTHTILGTPIAKTIAQIRVPATYRYHIPLAAEWKFRVAGDTLIAVAPSVKPSLPVAIDTGKLEGFSSGLWSPITGSDAVESLQRTITKTLGAKASSQSLLLLQRESARKTVTEFVQKWVLDQPRWKVGKTPTVLVFFEDEPLGARSTSLLSQSP